MTRPQETFTDMLARLFPMPGIQLGINSPHSKCITFQVTEDCNLRCSYCYQGCKTHRKMSLETAKAAVDMLLAADERTNQYITSTEVAGVVLDFIGGEPLLEVELIDQILDYFVAQTFRLHHPWATRWKASMSTNGTLYFRPEVQRFWISGQSTCHSPSALTEISSSTIPAASSQTALAAMLLLSRPRRIT